ncbi:MAG: NAD-dependent dehydratase [Acidobacteria bacterium]|nr:MAG: NAD-dependent dehydratase [Acidobacteriota bacterium]
MKVLIIGGTRFIGTRVVRRLIEEGHEVTVFHRGQTNSEIPGSVQHILGERDNLSGFASEFARIAPDIVLDMICYNEQEAETLMNTFRGIARRIVVASSMDVYRAYGCLLGLEAAPPDPMALAENSPLRESRFSYRGQAKGPDDMAFDYDKIPVEHVVMSDSDLPGTVLRLPAVYGPGDHRAFEHLKRMEDGRPVVLLEENHARWRWTRGYVDNVAAALALAVTDDRAASRIYNVGEADALTESEWVFSIGLAAAWTGEIVVLQKGAMPEHLAVPYSFEHHLGADTSRIRRELGYEDQITRDEAIRETVDWERAHPPDQVDAGRFNYAAEDAAIEKLEPRS